MRQDQRTGSEGEIRVSVFALIDFGTERSEHFHERLFISMSMGVPGLGAGTGRFGAK